MEFKILSKIVIAGLFVIGGIIIKKMIMINDSINQKSKNHFTRSKYIAALHDLIEHVISENVKDTKSAIEFSKAHITERENIDKHLNKLYSVYVDTYGTDISDHLLDQILQNSITAIWAPLQKSVLTGSSYNKSLADSNKIALEIMNKRKDAHNDLFINNYMRYLENSVA